ncbi:MAG: DUF488 domain-containing protein [Planctomycetes bacterium]|nr:DUF488 domain-containing protein [Planctomycetota bacterium]
MPGRIFTLGHSTLDIDSFVELCQSAEIDAIADVRSVPYSRMAPQHNRETIQSAFEGRRLVYVYMGNLLGGRPTRPSLFNNNGRADYVAMRQSSEFMEGIARIRKGLEQFNIGLMCGEEDPVTCHRALLIAPALAAIGLPPSHLRKGGRLESHRQFEDRLLEANGVMLSQGDLFLNRQTLVEQAIESMADRHAYRSGFEPNDQASE